MGYWDRNFLPLLVVKQYKIQGIIINMPEIIEVECPFCKKGKIRISRSPEKYTTQTIRVGSNRKTIPKLIPGKQTVLSEKCPNCGKSKKEIEDALKHGVPPSHEEIIRRAKEAGLPLKIK